LYLALSADPVPVLGELRLVADQLPDARAILAEAGQYQISPGCEFATCDLCGATDQQLVYKWTKAGFADRPVCDDDTRCDTGAKRAWLGLGAESEARAVVARAETAKDVLRRHQGVGSAVVKATEQHARKAG
jgi:hypothetical protein